MPKKISNVARGIAINRKVGEYVRKGGKHIDRSIAYWRRQYWGKASDPQGWRWGE